jgi:alpha-beta hydrolase superfamily lysophospholipase
MSVRQFCERLTVLMVIAIGTVTMTGGAWAQTRETVTIRGQTQSLRLYGSRGGVPVIVSSGDGGWIHLGPHVAAVLAAKGFFVVGFDVKAYLEQFTSGNIPLRPEDEPGDFKVIVDFAARGSSQKPILLGVSEGAGLSVLAASNPSLKREIAGVIGLGLPDINELGWRWKDALIYLTHDVPKEPTFRASAIVDRVAPVPLGLIHSTKDEFVPVAQAQDMLERAQEPKRLWIIKAADHRFSDNLPEFDKCLLEAITWITQHSAK